MSTTPETDALVEDIGMGYLVVPATFARHMETERNQWKNLYETSEWETLLSQALQRELEEARRVTAVLKWRCAKLQDDYDTQAKLIKKAKL
jgi:hypothetical protein